MSKKKDRCEICSAKKDLFLVEFTIEGYYVYCNNCLSAVIKEKPSTITMVWRLDNKHYEMIFKEEIKTNED